MGYAPHATLVWGVVVELSDPETGEDHPWGEDAYSFLPAESRLELVPAGHEDEPYAILTFKGSYQPSAYGWDPEDVEIGVTGIVRDMYEAHKDARKAEEERACDYPDFPDLRDGKWMMVASYG